MDFSLSNLRRLSYRTPATSNTTSVSSAQLPTILDAFIPGYTFFCKLVRDEVGFDVSNIVFSFFAVLASATAIRYLVNGVGSQIFRYCTAAVTVDSDDFIYECLVAWASEHPALNAARSLHVHSVIDGAECDAKSGRFLPQYEIYKGAHWFRHNGRLFKLAREDQQGSGMGVESRDKLTVTVFGRSTGPIKDLIMEARDRGISQRSRKGERGLRNMESE